MSRDDGPGIYGGGSQLGEDGDAKGFDFNDQSIRKGFIRKVYSILMCQLTVTMGFIALFLYHQPTQRYVSAHPVLWWVALGVMVVFLISMACCTELRRQAPMNLIFLGLFTLAESFMLGLAASHYKAEEVLAAIGITTAVCLALTLFAFQSKWDFTMMGGALLVASVVFLLFGIVAIFWKNNIVNLIYVSIGVVIFSFYLLYDTQLMMGGKHEYSISPEEYVFGALNLYLDIVNIFMNILKIIGALRDKDSDL